MSGTKGDTGSKVIKAGVGMAAAFGARKVIIFVGKKVTGKEPPEHPEDPQVALGDALLWGLVIGAGVHVARVLATREVAKRLGSDVADIVD